MLPLICWGIVIVLIVAIGALFFTMRVADRNEKLQAKLGLYQAYHAGYESQGGACLTRLDICPDPLWKGLGAFPDYCVDGELAPLVVANPAPQNKRREDTCKGEVVKCYCCLPYVICLVCAVEKRDPLRAQSVAMGLVLGQPLSVDQLDKGLTALKDKYDGKLRHVLLLKPCYDKDGHLSYSIAGALPLSALMNQIEPKAGCGRDLNAIGAICDAISGYESGRPKLPGLIFPVLESRGDYVALIREMVRNRHTQVLVRNPRDGRYYEGQLHSLLHSIAQFQ